MLKFSAQIILNIFFPIKCILCNKESIPLCERCITLLPESTLGVDTDIISVFDYRDKTVKKGLWTLKYNSNKGCGYVDKA